MVAQRGSRVARLQTMTTRWDAPEASSSQSVFPKSPVHRISPKVFQEWTLHRRRLTRTIRWMRSGSVIFGAGVSDNDEARSDAPEG